MIRHSFFHTRPMLPPGTNSVGISMVLRSALPVLTEFTQRTMRRIGSKAQEPMQSLDQLHH
jgi:hypothetical protein